MTSECVICRQLPVDEVRLSCCPQGVYCRECREAWLRSTSVAICPTCRTPVPVTPIDQSTSNNVRTLFHIILVLYTSLLVYEMFGMFGNVVCHSGYSIAQLIVMTFTAGIYTLMVMPIYAIVVAYWLIRPWPVWDRFWDMCGSVSGPFNYRCVYAQMEDHEWWNNSSQHVIYGHVVHVREVECTHYLMPPLLIAVQLLLIALLIYLYRLHAKRRFIY